MTNSITSFLQELSLSNQWLVLLPEISLALLSLVLLGLDLFGKASRQAVLDEFKFRISLMGQLAILALLIIGRESFNQSGSFLFGGLVEQSDQTFLMRCFFILGSIFVTVLAARFLSKANLPKAEYYHLCLLACAGFMLLVQSAQFVLFFVSLELVTIAFYILVAFNRTNALSLEAGLKYLTLGALSSAFLLFGIVLLYGISGNPNLEGYTSLGFQFSQLQEFIHLNADNTIVRVGALMVIAGICFKLGAFPFQIWIPDVYQGAPTPTTAFLATSSKAAGVFVLIQLLQGPFLALSEFLIPILSIICTITILYGNIAASGQSNVKRLLGLSGISHAGYLLMGIIASFLIPESFVAVFFYLCLYLLSSFLVFGLLVQFSQVEEDQLEIGAFRGLYSKNAFLGTMGIIGLGSLAGIPPLGGFIGKLLLLNVAFQAELYWLIGVALVGIVISIYYYFGWIRAMLTEQESEEQAIAISFEDRIIYGFIIALIVLLGLIPGILIGLIQ